MHLVAGVTEAFLEEAEEAEATLEVAAVKAALPYRLLQ